MQWDDTNGWIVKPLTGLMGFTVPNPNSFPILLFSTSFSIWSMNKYFNFSVFSFLFALSESRNNIIWFVCFMEFPLQLQYPMVIHVYHPYRQPDGINHCEAVNGHCSHLCLPAPRINERSPRISCSCPNGHRLMEDGQTCLEDGNLYYFIFYFYIDYLKCFLTKIAMKLV